MTTLSRETLRQVNLASLHSSERFEYWSDVICALYAPSDNDPLCARDDFYGELTHHVLGSVEISEIKSSSIVSVRDADGVRRKPADDIIVSYLVEGEAHLEQGGRQAIQGPGALVMYDAGQPFTYRFGQQYHGYWVRIPRNVIKSRVPSPERLAAHAIRDESAVVLLAGQMVQQTMHVNPTMDSVLASRLGSSVADVLITALQLELGGEQKSTQRNKALLLRIKQYIDCHLDDPNLSVEDAANAIGVSQRTLNRLFAAEGTTAVRWLWSRRLERSHEMLAKGLTRRVTDVALSCGFTDFSHFSRAFKRMFGVAPTSLLRS